LDNFLGETLKEVYDKVSDKFNIIYLHELEGRNRRYNNSSRDAKVVKINVTEAGIHIYYSRA